MTYQNILNAPEDLTEILESWPGFRSLVDYLKRVVAEKALAAALAELQADPKNEFQIPSGTERTEETDSMVDRWNTGRCLYIRYNGAEMRFSDAANDPKINFNNLPYDVLKDRIFKHSHKLEDAFSRPVRGYVRKGVTQLEETRNEEEVEVIPAPAVAGTRVSLFFPGSRQQ